MLFRAGVYFKSHEFGAIPKTISEAKRFIEANRAALLDSAHRRENARLKAVAEAVATEEKCRLARQSLKRKRKQPNQALQP
jgi:hypothetical protein